MPGTWTCSEDEDFGSLGDNKVIVINGTSGSPATAADFVTADRAGEAVLLAATACAVNMTLSYQIRPTMAIALSLDFILSGTSAGSEQSWTASSYNVTTGTHISGAASDTETDNGTYLQIEETVGSPCLDFDLTWSGLPNNGVWYPDKVFVNGYYDGNPAHDVFIYMWNYDTTAWVRLTAAAQDFPDDSSDQDYTFDVPTVNTEDYFSSGAAKVRINHTSSGSAGHDFYLDQILFKKTVTDNVLAITGTDWDDQAQSESIDVSGGDGTYNGANKWRTITDIDCTGWADGTLRVTQPQWGLIWDYGNSCQYQIAGTLDTGDSSTATYFTSILEMVYFADGPKLFIKTNATLQLGKLADAWGINGSTWSIGPGSTNNIFPPGETGTFYIYDSRIHNRAASTCNFYSGTVVAKNAIFSAEFFKDQDWHRWWVFRSTLTELTIDKCYFPNINNLNIAVTPTSFIDNHVHKSEDGFKGETASMTIPSLLVTSTTRYDVITNSATTTTMQNPEWLIVTPRINDAAGVIQETYTCNIRVVDQDGNALAGVTVLCEDTDDSEIFSVSTDGSGDIAEQEIPYKRWSGTSETLKTHSPHKFTFRNAGYDTLIYEGVVVNQKINWWNVELQQEIIRTAFTGESFERTAFGAR